MNSTASAQTAKQAVAVFSNGAQRSVPAYARRSSRQTRQAGAACNQSRPRPRTARWRRQGSWQRSSALPAMRPSAAHSRSVRQRRLRTEQPRSARNGVRPSVRAARRSGRRRLLRPQKERNRNSREKDTGECKMFASSLPLGTVAAPQQGIRPHRNRGQQWYQKYRTSLPKAQEAMYREYYVRGVKKKWQKEKGTRSR